MDHRAAIQLINNRLGSKATNLFKALADQTPSLADAIVFLQGDQLDRAEKVLELFRAGWAPFILVTGNNVMMAQRRLAGEDDLPVSELTIFLDKAGLPKSQTIIDDQAMNTKDQATRVIRLAKKNNWRRLILVCSSYHLLRAHLTFTKQKTAQEWTGKLIWQYPELAWTTIPAGRQKNALAMLEEELSKIESYKVDLSTDLI